MNALYCRTVQFAMIGCLALSAQGIDYYIANGSGDGEGCSSIDGTSVPGKKVNGWALSSGGSRSYSGITDVGGIYHIDAASIWLRAPTNGTYATPATSSIVVEPGKFLGLGDYNVGREVSLTLNNVSIGSGASLALSDTLRSVTATNTLDGAFSLEDGNLQFRRRNSNIDFRLAADVSGSGALEFQAADNAKSGFVHSSITGDLSEFKGNLVVYSGATSGAATTLALELASAASIPSDPDAGDTACVVVTNGAMLIIDYDWNSSDSRVWDFGDGLTPTVYVAEGATVTIDGEIVGTAGFNKAGPGTLALTRESTSFSGACNILSGKVVLMGKAQRLASQFRRKSSIALPEGYTMLESLSLSGGNSSSYIDTGYTPTDGHFGFVFDYSLGNAPGSSGGRLMGSSKYSQYSTGSWGGFMVSSWGETGYSGQFCFGLDKPYIPVDGGQVEDTRMRMSLMNGSAELSRGWRHHIGTTAPEGFYGSVYLGNVHTDSMNKGQPVAIYRFMVFEGDTLVHDFVPVRKNSDGTVGIYDTKGELRFRSANASYCTAGADYDSDSDDQWLELTDAEITADRVVVTNGATLKVERDWNTSEGQDWDFGEGARPTIYVAEGYTLTINGTITGSSGFNKAGPGTLIITKASPMFSGLCNILSGKVYLRNSANELARYFRRRKSLPIPAGYTKLESLSLAGGAQNSYIDTGYTPTDGHFGFVFDYSLGNAPGSTGGRVMGSSKYSQYSTGSWGGFMVSSWGLTGYSGQLCFGLVTPKIPVDGGQVEDTRMRMSLMNGSAELSRGWRHHIGTTAPEGFYGSVYLGNVHTDSMNKGQPVTLYRFMVFEGDTLVHDFVPVRDSGGAVGIYDTVGDSFHAAADAQYCTPGAVYDAHSDDQWIEVDSLAGLAVFIR